MAISRYGARVIPNTMQTIAALDAEHRLVRGPHVEVFERLIADRVGAAHAVSASWGRMAFFHILRALRLPRGSEIIIPALTFWVVPEMARAAGLRPVFADVDPATFTLDPAAFEAAITGRTSAVVPTHLYGLACDMSAILAIARRRGLAVIEDCAHALGATYRGQSVGTLGDAGFFSFQLLKPLNTYGGGMAVTSDTALASRIRESAADCRDPSEGAVRYRLLFGRGQRIMMRPPIFSATLFPVFWAASWFRANPDLYFWESIRPLTPMPPSYLEGYSNVQAALGIEGLTWLDEWIAATQAHAALLTRSLAGIDGVRTPVVPHDRTHVFYQYAIFAADRDDVVRRCLRRGVDVETLHVDVCTSLDLFKPPAGERHAPAPGAERAATAIQLPVYASLSDMEISRVASVVTEVTRRAGRHGRGLVGHEGQERRAR